jgi:hypothetical protein
MLSPAPSSKRIFSQLLAGDWLVLVIASLLVILLFKMLWQHEAATKLRIRTGDKIYATFSLDQQRKLIVHGPLGDSHIVISKGRVRFESSPCNNQYCVHQGWLSHAGQVAICLPNQVSLELTGAEKSYDSLNY